jgi:hypothetical protein
LSRLLNNGVDGLSPAITPLPPTSMSQEKRAQKTPDAHSFTNMNNRFSNVLAFKLQHKKRLFKKKDPMENLYFKFFSIFLDISGFSKSYPVLLLSNKCITSARPGNCQKIK